jgi:hypothetical protein
VLQLGAEETQPSSDAARERPRSGGSLPRSSSNVPSTQWRPLCVSANETYAKPMTQVSILGILRADALARFVLGLLLVLGSWDGLYDSLDLPQGKPALFPQLGGLAFVLLAFVLWVASDLPTVTRPIALAAAVVNALSALLLIAWMLFRDLNKVWDVGVLGYVLLSLVAGVLVILAVAELLLLRRQTDDAREVSSI